MVSNLIKTDDQCGMGNNSTLSITRIIGKQIWNRVFPKLNN